MSNGERPSSASGEQPAASRFDILTEGTGDGHQAPEVIGVPRPPEEIHVVPAEDGNEGQPQTPPETAETDTPSQEEEARREALEARRMEKIAILNKYSFREASAALTALGSSLADYMGKKIVVEHTDGESAEQAGWITYDQLIDKLKADYGDRTVVAPVEGGTTGEGTPTNTGEGTPAETGDGSEGGPAVIVAPVGGEGASTDTGENAGDDNEGASGDNDTLEAEDNTAERKDGKLRSFFKKLGVGALLLATLVGIGGGAQVDKQPAPEEPSTSMTEAEAAIEQENNFEILSMDEAYRDLFADAENDEYNKEKAGRYNFAPSLDRYRSEMGEAVKGMDDVELMGQYVGERTAQMVEALPFYIVDLPSVIDQVDALRDARAEKGSDLTAIEINQILESDDEARTQAIEEFRAWIDMAVAGGESEVTELNGKYWNCYMRNTKGEGQNFTHEDIEGVICQTDENGSKAVILRNGDEYIIIKEQCTQPVRLEKLADVPEIPPEENPQTPDVPDPVVPDPTEPDPTESDPTVPDPTEPDPTEPKLDPKNPEDEKLPDGHTWEPEPLGPQTPESEIPDTYNPEEGTFVAPGETPGTSQGDVDARPEVQVGAVDTSTTESADGSGSTIAEVIDDADASTVTPGGEVVAEQTSGDTVQQEIASAEQQAQQQAAVGAQAAAEATQTEVLEEADTDGDGTISTDENANMFNSGMY